MELVQASGPHLRPPTSTFYRTYVQELTTLEKNSSAPRKSSPLSVRRDRKLGQFRSARNIVFLYYIYPVSKKSHPAVCPSAARDLTTNSGDVAGMGEGGGGTLPYTRRGYATIHSNKTTSVFDKTEKMLASSQARTTNISRVISPIPPFLP